MKNCLFNAVIRILLLSLTCFYFCTGAVLSEEQSSQPVIIKPLDDLDSPSAPVEASSSTVPSITIEPAKLTEIPEGTEPVFSGPENIKVVIMEREMDAVIRRMGKAIFLPAEAGETREIVNSFAGEITWKNEELTIKKNKERVVLKEDTEEVTVGKEKFKNPLQILDGKPHVNFHFLAAFLQTDLSRDKKTGNYYLDPLITELRLKHNKGKYDLRIRASSPIKVKDFFLREPARYVIDIPNAVLGIEPVKMVHPDAGEIRYGQFSTTPNKVRVVIPLTQDVRVKMKSRLDLCEAVIGIELPPVYTPGQNFTRQKIKDVQINDLPGDKGVRIRVLCTGPVQYEWHRLRQPDNRIFIDFAQAILIGPKKTRNLSDSAISQVRVAQFQVKPFPITRVVLALKEPVEVEFQTSKRTGNQLIMLVKHNKIDPEKSILRGVGATGYPLAGAVICIDPGHGGSDPGAINRYIGLKEKDLTLDISQRLAKILTGWGWNIVLTRYDDRDVSYQGSSAREELGARVRVANDMGADIFISIHINASYNRSLNGTSVHYFKSKDKKLAWCLLKGLLSCAKRKNKGVRRNKFYVLAHSRMPAALVECCFLSNPQEAHLLQRPDFRQKLAEGIAEGLRIYKSK
ncbi:MAG: N-acetylmuramoyl-L-alanine amidase [Candidatus Eremiobacteraeota bacterium]|nr:N-acetylmuramoyl-L-alanine amidase [Candidatus Eremiobacteraeota bacterium]